MILDSTPTAPTVPDLGSSGIQDGMNQSLTAGYLLQAYTQTVLQTPDITLPAVVDTDSGTNVVEELPVHQALARTNATYYLTTINPAIVQTTSEIIGYGNKYISYYPKLIDLADDLDAGNNRQQFIDGINNLLSKANGCEAQAQQVADLLNAFLPLISTDAQNFSTDSNAVAIALDGEDGEISLLQKQIDAYNKAMNIDMGIVAGGALVDAVGGALILVGILGSFESAGTSISLVVAGIGLVTAGSTIGAMAFSDYEDQRANYMTTLQELNTDEQVYATTQQASATVSSLLTAVEGGISAVIYLQNKWAQLQGDLQQVIDAVTDASTDTGTWLISDLNAAYSDWTTCVELATSIQANGTLPVETQTVSR